MKHALVLAMLLLPAMIGLAANPPGWTDDYEKAVAKAKAESKHVLLDFTGSDWCGWCMKIDDEVFDKAAFKSFAKDTLVLVKVDFPHNKKLQAKTKEQNDKLKSKYGANGFPTLIIVDSEGKEVWRQAGYKPGGPKAFIESVSGVLKKTS